MDESAPIRAIVIGVSTFLAIATISAVLMYYNTAKQMASNVGRGQDFAQNYEKSIQDILKTGSYNVENNVYITGADVKNLLNYFHGNDNVWISISGIKVIKGYNESTYTSQIDTDIVTYTINDSLNDEYDNDYDKAIKNISDSQRFNINVTENTTLEVGKKGTYITINSEDK